MNWDQKYQLNKIASLLNKCNMESCPCRELDDDTDNQVTSLITNWIAAPNLEESQKIKSTLKDLYTDLKNTHRDIAYTHIKCINAGGTSPELQKSHDYHRDIQLEHEKILNNFDSLFTF
jgi:hypothetical protein